MAHLRQAINDLITKMDNDLPLRGSAEAITRNYLRDISTATDRAQQADELASPFCELRAYGRASTNQCSPLSKGIAKLMIILEDSSGVMEGSSGGAT